MTSGTLAVSAPARRVAQRRTHAPNRPLRRLLLMATIVALPLQDHLPPVGRFSVMYILFALLALVAVVAQPSDLLHAAVDRVFIAWYGLLAVSLVIEALHTGAAFEWWARLAQMIAGGVVIASYCRRRKDVQTILTAWIIASLWVSYVIARGAYSAITAAGVSGFEEASILRTTALSGIGLRANWNTLAFLCAGSAALAMARAIVATSWTRLFYAGAALLATFTTFLTFSRSGIAALGLAAIYVFFASLRREFFLRSLGIAIAVVLVIWLAVPRTVFERFQFTTSYDAGGRQEARIRVYSIVIRELPAYAAFGVGSGNFWNWWALEHGLETGGDPTGAHDVFLQIILYWGAFGLIATIVAFFVTWQTLWSAVKRDVEWIGVRAFCITVFLDALSSHDISDKAFSITLGVIVGIHILKRREYLSRLHRTTAVAVPTP